MRIDIATLFPQMCDAVMDTSVIGRARRDGLFELYCHNIRDFTLDRQKRVDDYPYGGGHGMIMQADPIARCLDFILWQYEKAGKNRPHICFLTPGGAVYRQDKANELARLPGLVLVCGHYEGIDERVVEMYSNEEICIGDFVLSGGELAALAVADSIFRLLPGVLASPQGYREESFYAGLLEHPQYSRPKEWRGVFAPEVLLSGHAANIAAWRHAQSVARTQKRRPDLYLKLPQEAAAPNRKQGGKK